MKKRILFRIFDPGHGRKNIFRFAARITMSLGPVVVATMAKRMLSWLDVQVVNENNAKEKRGAPLDEDGLIDHVALQKQHKADIVGISASITNAVPRVLKIIWILLHMAKNLRPKAIIVGGWHAGDDPEPFLRAGADVVVHGEADLVIAPIIEALCNGYGLEEIPGISYRVGETIHRNPIANSAWQNCAKGQEGYLVVPQDQMDFLPDPDFGLVQFAKIKIMPVYRTRGCSGKCHFCRVKGVARYLSPERLLAQIQNGHGQGVNRFFIVDDRSEEEMLGFITSLQLIVDWIESCNIKKLDISAQYRLSLAGFDPANDRNAREAGVTMTGLEILALIRKAHINTVCIGFESPIKEELGAMAKPIKQSEMLDWARIWKSFGFLVHCMMIFGYPIRSGLPLPRNAAGEVMTAAGRAEVFWDFIKKAKPTYLQLLIFSPIIGTDDYKWLVAEGRILPGIPLKYHDGLHVLYRPDEGIMPQEIQHEAIKLSRKFYARWFWQFGWLALAIHSLRVGTIVCSMPFLWAALMPFKGCRARHTWQTLRRFKRISLRHWGAQFIIVKFMGSLHIFKSLLTRIERENKPV
jgi:radical SAM superfamily enzyme YgiQ (UPF0313 family)